MDVDDLAAILEGKTAPRAYWAFCANPDLYRIEAAVEDLVGDHWTTKGRPSVLRNLSVSRGQGTVFYVTPSQWEDVVRLAGGWPEEISEPESVGGLLGRNTSSVLQGRLADTMARQVIEQYAGIAYQACDRRVPQPCQSSALFSTDGNGRIVRSILEYPTWAKKRPSGKTRTLNARGQGFKI
jgi:hypothetical protein